MSEDVGKLILRMALGGMILVHGIDKLTGGFEFILEVVVGAGLPAFTAYGIFVGELVAPLMIMSGWHARVGASLIAINMAFAIGLVHAADVFMLGSNGGWSLDSQGMFFFTAVALAFTGPGRFRVDLRKGSQPPKSAASQQKADDRFGL